MEENQVVKKSTSIEDLSNEIFYEIFEYFTGIDIYEIFSELNIRFQSLVIHSSQRLKIIFDQKSIQKCIYENFLIPNKDRIVSLRLPNMSTMMEFLHFIPMDSSLSSLESLHLHEITTHQIFASLTSLQSLPRLLLLTVQITDGFESQIIYQILSHLPVLKYSKVSSKSSTNHLGSMFSDRNTYSKSIEHLILDHGWTIDQLVCTLLYTPELRYLNCTSLQKSYFKTISLPINLFNLKCIVINNHSVFFDEFETLFTRIRAPIEILRFKTSLSMDFVDADRWQQCITQYLPQLHTFYLQCSIKSNERFPTLEEHRKSKGFTSSFWTERQWIFEFKINMKDASCAERIYSIHPYRKRWCDEFKCIDNDNHSKNQQPSVGILRSFELILTGNCSDEQSQSFISDNRQLFKEMQIHCVTIENYQLSMQLLIQILCVLPDIDALRISSFPPDISETIRVRETNIYAFVSKNNNLTKVYLDNIDELKMVHFLSMKLWTRVRHVEMTCAKNVNIELIMRIILTKYIACIPHLDLLCLCSTYFSYLTVEQLRIVINRRKLLNNYTIKRINNKLYIQWK